MFSSPVSISILKSDWMDFISVLLFFCVFKIKLEIERYTAYKEKVCQNQVLKVGSNTLTKKLV
jgi:hypothetical protein